MRASIALSIQPAAQAWWKFEPAIAASFPVSRTSAQRFIGDPTQTGLGIFAENFDRDSWLAGAGVSFAPKKNLTLYVDVNGDFQSQGTLVSVMGGLRFSW